MSEITEIIETFELLGDWEARYQYLVELGERLDTLPDVDKIEPNRVKPCMSTVFVTASRDSGNPALMRYRGDCDTAIIKGVLALLIQMMSGKTPREVLDLDVDMLFEGLNLQEHLSPARHVGIFAIVEQMKREALCLSSDAA